MAVKQSRVTRVNEEKLLNDMFVVLEYSDTFKEFVANMSEEAREALNAALLSAKAGT